MKILYTDGGCSGNGNRNIAERRMIAVVSDERGKILVEKKQMGGSNNVAELLAVKEALFWCVANNVPEVAIRTDSKNNLAWVYGSRLGKHLNDRDAVQNLCTTIRAVTSRILFHLYWIPRDENLAGHYIEQKYAL